MEKDSTEVSSGQVMSMLQKMMEKMEQENTKRDQDYKDLTKYIKDEVAGVKKEIVQTSNRLYFVEEAMKRSSRTSSRTTSRATSPTAAGIPTITKISDGMEQQSTTPLPQMRSKRMFTLGTTYEHEGLEILLRGMEINNKMPLSKRDMRSKESSKVIHEESELQPVHGPLISVSISTPRDASDVQDTEIESKQFTKFESHNTGCQDSPGGVLPELSVVVVDSLDLLEVVSSETQKSQVDTQCLTISLNEDIPVQVFDATFLETKSAAVFLDLSRFQKDFDGPETQVSWEAFQFFSTLLGKKDVSGLERVSHVWKPLFLLVYDSLLKEFWMLQSLQF
jgi:hypothetical protein